MNTSKFLDSGGKRGKWLLALGAVLMAFALTKLYMLPSLVQYIAPAPTELSSDEAPEGGAKPESQLSLLNKDWEARRAELGDGAQAGLAAFCYETYVDSSDQSENATLVCVGEGWFDAQPKFLLDGYLFSHADYEKGSRRIVLDEELAFKLFPTTEAVGSRVQLNGVWYDVIAVVRRTESMGDTDEYRMYIPLDTAANEHIQTDYLQLECLVADPSEKRALESVGSEVLGDGCYYDLDKEVMRASMIVRVLGMLFALYALGRIFGGWNRRTVALVNGWNEEVMHCYFKTMLPKVIALSALQIAGYAAILGAAWAGIGLIIEPMYVFTEWIPDNIASWSSISGRVEGLLLQNARIARYQTCEYAAIRVYGALVRWGAISTLAGAALYKVWPERNMKRRKDRLC